MFRGQRARISVDAFPDATLHGTVDSLAPGSGGHFSLLPPENATGNFTKIVQRVPVKILLDPHDPVIDQHPPRPLGHRRLDTRTTPSGPKATLVPGSRIVTADSHICLHDWDEAQAARRMHSRAASTRQPELREWVAVFGGILGAFMAVLDIQITNASLVYIQGGLAASVDEGAGSRPPISWPRSSSSR